MLKERRRMSPRMRGQWLLMLAMAHSGIAYGGDWEE